MTDLANLETLPQYKRVTQMRAAQITAIVRNDPIPGVNNEVFTLVLGEGLGEVPVAADWLLIHQPGVNDYFVVSEDGTTGMEPEEAFEKNFVRC